MSPRLIKTSLLLTLMMLQGCGRLGYDALPNDSVVDASAVPDGAASGARTWGEHIANLPVAGCVGTSLTVNSVGDEMDGDPLTLAAVADAGTQLSLREALAIAGNNAGPYAIRFEPSAYAVDNPAVVAMTCDELPLLSETCVDGRGGGVILSWPSECISGGLNLANQSKLMGITVLQHPGEIGVVNSQLAGVRVNTDGQSSMPGSSFFDLRAGSASIVGPGNVFVGRWDISAPGGSTAVIVDNYFGIDPVSNTAIGSGNAIEVGSFNDAVNLTVEGNVFALSGSLFWDPTTPATVTFQNNFVGVTRENILIPGDWLGVQGLLDGTFKIGPGNIIRGVSTAIAIQAANVQVTQNSIYENAAGIVYSPEVVIPPTIDSVTASSISGTCPVDGTIEIFSDAADQGETFIVSVPCANTFGFAGPLPAGRNVVATLTDGQGRTSAFSTPMPVPSAP